MAQIRRRRALPQASSFLRPLAETTDGFDGARAFKHVEQLVAIGRTLQGPREFARTGVHRCQLRSFGCAVDEQDFHASTPVGDVP